MHFDDALGPDWTTVRLVALVDDLLRQPAEADWLEFKHNNRDPRMIGTLISPLSNAARLADRDRAYIAWGVADGTHTVSETIFQPSSDRVGNQPLEM